MEQALSLAKLALGQSSPNPAVGAIVVKDGVVVGQGYTQPPGSWHAEAMALNEARGRAGGGTMYVTLEPCCHHGRTPPCTQAIIGAGISEVHLAAIDPNPLVSGRGKDDVDIMELAKIRANEMQELAASLPEELRARYAELLSRARHELETDPNFVDGPPPSQ